ncbi:hypothetical protein DFH08DRAFT_1071367 [Mycena albidolilacea]|uniref:Uncharacterized protein n=1 Tax=Mycena albidolilacea TaxID=1033008 RepID=A0AAD7AVD5_9AGAR|nr:hypothetical protein DFH08DRAFT_1071367 [Mycena albidolilacea]
MGITAAQKKAIEEVMEILLKAQGFRPKRQLAGMFLELVDRDDWKDYYEVIPEPRCLDGIQSMLEKNKYKDALDVYTDLSLVFLNALFYNEPDSQIAADAQTLKDRLEAEWKARPLPTPRESPPPTSAQKVHEPKPKKTRPQPQPTPAPKLNPPAAAPTLTVPQPSTSTFVYSKPIPIHPAPVVVSPVAPPPPELPEPESESEEEDWTDDEYDPPPGAPTDIQIVRQLERGLPRYNLVLGADGGWMADVKHDRHLEIMQAIKAYREANVKLSTVLEPGIPEDKLTISFRLLESRSRSKTFYTSSSSFDADVARMFENARRYYLGRCNSVAGVGGDEWSRVVALQRIAHVLTSPHAPSLPLAEPIVIPPPLRSPGAHALDSVMHKGFVLRPKDYVHVVSGAETEGETMGRPFMGRITACWRDDAGEGGVSVRWYIRADEISHLMPTRSTGPIQGEVIQTDKITHHPVLDVIERVACQHISAASRGRPRAPAWYPGWPLYVCAHRYDAVRARVRRILRAEWYNNDSAEGNGSDAPLDLFERPVRLGGQRKKQGAVVDRSVVTAGGVAVSAVDKLGPETTRHFERDPTTGEVLWFPGPPLHVARAPPPRHRLEYLHFLAKKYRPDAEAEVVSVKSEPLPDSTEKPTVNGNGNGNGVVDDPMGSDDARAQSVDADMVVISKEADAGAELVGVEPPAKRQKVEEKYLSASERIREALKAVEVEL